MNICKDRKGWIDRGGDRVIDKLRNKNKETEDNIRTAN